MIKFVLYLVLVGGGSLDGRAYDTERECKAQGRAMVARHANVTAYMCTTTQVKEDTDESEG